MGLAPNNVRMGFDQPCLRLSDTIEKEAGIGKDLRTFALVHNKLVELVTRNTLARDPCPSTKTAKHKWVIKPRHYFLFFREPYEQMFPSTPKGHIHRDATVTENHFVFVRMFALLRMATMEIK